MPTEEELDKKMDAVRKLHLLFLEKMKRFEINRDMQKENNLLLQALLEEHKTNEGLKMVMGAFLWDYKNFCVAR